MKFGFWKHEYKPCAFINLRLLVIYTRSCFWQLLESLPTAQVCPDLVAEVSRAFAAPAQSWHRSKLPQLGSALGEH